MFQPRKWDTSGQDGELLTSGIRVGRVRLLKVWRPISSIWRDRRGSLNGKRLKINIRYMEKMQNRDYLVHNIHSQHRTAILHVHLSHVPPLTTPQLQVDTPNSQFSSRTRRSHPIRQARTTPGSKLMVHTPTRAQLHDLRVHRAQLAKLSKKLRLNSDRIAFLRDRHFFLPRLRGAMIKLKIKLLKLYLLKIKKRLSRFLICRHKYRICKTTITICIVKSVEHTGLRLQALSRLKRRLKHTKDLHLALTHFRKPKQPSLISPDPWTQQTTILTAHRRGGRVNSQRNLKPFDHLMVKSMHLHPSCSAVGRIASKILATVPEAKGRLSRLAAACSWRTTAKISHYFTGIHPAVLLPRQISHPTRQQMLSKFLLMPTTTWVNPLK